MVILIHDIPGATLTRHHRQPREWSRTYYEAVVPFEAARRFVHLRCHCEYLPRDQHDWVDAHVRDHAPIAWRSEILEILARHDREECTICFPPPPPRREWERRQVIEHLRDQLFWERFLYPCIRDDRRFRSNNWIKRHRRRHHKGHCACHKSSQPLQAA